MANSQTYQRSFNVLDFDEIGSTDLQRRHRDPDRSGFSARCACMGFLASIS